MFMREYLAAPTAHRMTLSPDVLIANETVATYDLHIGVLFTVPSAPLACS